MTHQVNRSPAGHRRRALRLKGYDYAQAGAYFVTICTHGRPCLFGDVIDDSVQLNGAGQMLAALWNDIPIRFPDIELDAFVVMPNHLHCVIVLLDVGATTRVAHGSATTLGDVVGAFKSLTTVEYVRGVKAKGWPEFQGRLWQRSYYEHVIRDEKALNRVRRYIDENPARWAFDDENPQKTGS